MKLKELLQNTLGAPIEAQLNELVDKHLTVDALSEKIEREVIKKVGASNELLVRQIVGAASEAIRGSVDEWRAALKANIIDKIDGEDDLPDIELGKGKGKGKDAKK